MNDVVGDGGHGRGLFQIDDRSHTDFLRENGAGGAGGKPPVGAAAKYAAALLRGNFDFGVAKGVRKADRTKFMLSAYNAGAGGALAGPCARATPTSGRPAATTASRCWRATRCSRSSSGIAPKPELKLGSRGRRVTALKVDLAAWYDRHLPGEWEKFKIKPGPYYGEKLVTAVRDFQTRVGPGHRRRHGREHPRRARADTHERAEASR